jgi:hypothetical protein
MAVLPFPFLSAPESSSARHRRDFVSFAFVAYDRGSLHLKQALRDAKLLAWQLAHGQSPGRDSCPPPPLRPPPLKEEKSPSLRS